MKFHVTLRMALLTLTGIVADFGAGYTYSGVCVYVHRQEDDGTITPACIVGQAFHRWGILRTLVAANADLSAWAKEQVAASPEGYYAYGSPRGTEVENTDGLCNLANFSEASVGYLADLGITFDPDAAAFLLEAQQQQDNGVPWGEAVNLAAESALRNRGEFVGNAVERLANLLTS